MKSGQATGWIPSFCKQIIRPENRKLTENASQRDDDLVVCINEIKMGMFAKSALFPGANTLILNLILLFLTKISMKFPKELAQIFRRGSRNRCS